MVCVLRLDELYRVCAPGDVPEAGQIGEIDREATGTSGEVAQDGNAAVLGELTNQAQQ